MRWLRGRYLSHNFAAGKYERRHKYITARENASDERNEISPQYHTNFGAKINGSLSDVMVIPTIDYRR
ncbi:Hypothetical predicted protein [Octopus vulgaris]|uniref:Uncharacterized protein n=1 Tax=Octopus vulgaris TaxID=6645 RepID=A0AA36F627_OCTVU|nr:Hypothetical predicted protein [Octopus vulgaris]